MFDWRGRPQHALQPPVRFRTRPSPVLERRCMARGIVLDMITGSGSSSCCCRRCSLPRVTLPRPARRRELFGRNARPLVRRWIGTDTAAARCVGRPVLYRWWTSGCRSSAQVSAAIETLRTRHDRRGLSGAVFHPSRRATLPGDRFRSRERLGVNGVIAADDSWSQLNAPGSRRIAPRQREHPRDAKGVIRHVHPAPLLPVRQSHSTQGNVRSAPRAAVAKLGREGRRAGMMRRRLWCGGRALAWFPGRDRAAYGDPPRVGRRRPATRITPDNPPAARLSDRPGASRSRFRHLARRSPWRPAGPSCVIVYRRLAALQGPYTTPRSPPVDPLTGLPASGFVHASHTHSARS